MSETYEFGHDVSDMPFEDQVEGLVLQGVVMEWDKLYGPDRDALFEWVAASMYPPQDVDQVRETVTQKIKQYRLDHPSVKQ